MSGSVALSSATHRLVWLSHGHEQTVPNAEIELRLSMSALGLLPVAITEEPGMRLDFILASPRLARRVTGAFIDREERLDEAKPGPSDHAPVIVDLAD